MLIIPLQSLPNQTVTVTLGDQACQINVFQKDGGIFVDVYVSNALIIAGVLARNLRQIVISAYLGFLGDLMFYDNQGMSDPDYTGLGGRYSLVYLSASEVSALAFPAS